MAVRVLVLVLAVVLAGLAAIDLHDSDRCHGDMSGILSGAIRVTDSEVDQLLADCRGSQDLAYMSNLLQRVGLPRFALRMAHEAVRREPGNFDGWLALSRAFDRQGRPAAAARALRRALALNPRYAETTG